MNMIIEIENIPAGVIEDIKRHYTEVSFENYNKPVTTECVTKKCNYARFVNHNTVSTLIDPITFETKEIVGGDIMEGYVVRGVFTEATADIYAVIPSGLFVTNNTLE